MASPDAPQRHRPQGGDHTPQGGDHADAAGTAVTADTDAIARAVALRRAADPGPAETGDEAPPSAATGAGRQRRWIAAAMVLAALPTLGTAVWLWICRPRFVVMGDQALLVLATRNAAGLHQLLGPYDRFGWAHPGPAWFYLMAPGYLAGGSTTAAAVAAEMLVHTVAAAAVVAVLGRWRGRWAALAGAAGVVLYEVAVVRAAFAELWNPYALLLPTVLFLVLVARAAAGSRLALVGVALTGTFLVQTHVGMVPLVAAGVVTGVGGLVVGAVAARRGGPSHRRTVGGGRGGVVAGVAGCLLVVLAWVPPVVQQVTHRPGNLGELLLFFRHPPHLPRPGIGQALTAVGRGFAVFPFGITPPDEVPSRLSLPAVAAVVGVLMAAVVLAALGWRLRDGMALWIGVVGVVGTAVAVVAVTRIVGDVEWYLLLWMAAIPVVLAVGWATLIFTRLLPGRALRWSMGVFRRQVPVVAGVCVLALAAGSVVKTVAMARAVGHSQTCCYSPGTDQALSALASALPDPDTVTDRDVLIDTDHSPATFLPLAPGLVLGLTTAGWHPELSPGAAHYQVDTATSAPFEVLFLPPVGTVPAGARVIAALHTEFGPARLALRDTAPA